MNDALASPGARWALAERPLAVTLAPADGARMTINVAAVGLVRLEPCESVRHVRHILGSTGATMFIASARDTDGVLVDALVAELRLQAAGLTIVVVVPHDAPIDDFRRLERLGVAQVFHAGEAGLRGQMEALVERATFRARLNRLADTGAASFAPSARGIVRHAIERGDAALTVDELATGVGLERRELERRCERTGLSTPEVIIGGGRVIAVSTRLDSSLSVVESVALECGFPSHAALCGFFDRYAQMTPTEARRLGADHVLARVIEMRLRRRPRGLLAPE